MGKLVHQTENASQGMVLGVNCDDGPWELTYRKPPHLIKRYTIQLEYQHASFLQRVAPCTVSRPRVSPLGLGAKGNAQKVPKHVARRFGILLKMEPRVDLRYRLAKIRCQIER